MLSKINPLPRSVRRISGSIFIHAAVLLAVASMAVPARAADDRVVKTRVSPVYPELAKRMRITGVVRIEATVSPEGKVTAVRALSGSSVLAPAAEDAVSKWRYVPSTAASTVDVDVNFSIAQ